MHSRNLLSLVFLIAGACATSDEAAVGGGGGKADDATCDDDCKVNRDRTRLLGAVLALDATQDQLFAGGFELASIRMEEADDGGTEPLYDIVVVNWNTQTNHCFTLELDTDEPDPALVRLEQHPMTECE